VARGEPRRAARGAQKSGSVSPTASWAAPAGAGGTVGPPGPAWGRWRPAASRPARAGPARWAPPATAPPPAPRSGAACGAGARVPGRRRPRAGSRARLAWATAATGRGSRC
jgi:hypothetical protein